MTNDASRVTGDELPPKLDGSPASDLVVLKVEARQKLSFRVPQDRRDERNK